MLLRMLPPADLQGMLSHLRRVSLPLGTVLVKSGAPVDDIWFMETGTASMIVLLDDGSQVEVGLIGAEGLVGSSVALGSPTSALDGIIQAAGSALRMPAARFRSSLAAIPALGPLVYRFVHTFQSQVSRSTACNARHLLEQRLAKWILSTHDRVEGDRFHMTQEFMSTMLGVRRQGVTVGVGALERAGLIHHERGFVTVRDRAGLEQATCECYALIRGEYDWLMPGGTISPELVR